MDDDDEDYGSYDDEDGDSQPSVPQHPTKPTTDAEAMMDCATTHGLTIEQAVAVAACFDKMPNTAYFTTVPCVISLMRQLKGSSKKNSSTADENHYNIAFDILKLQKALHALWTNKEDKTADDRIPLRYASGG